MGKYSHICHHSYNNLYHILCHNLLVHKFQKQSYFSIQNQVHKLKYMLYHCLDYLNKQMMNYWNNLMILLKQYYKQYLNFQMSMLAQLQGSSQDNLSNLNLIPKRNQLNIKYMFLDPNQSIQHNLLLDNQHTHLLVFRSCMIQIYHLDSYKSINFKLKMCNHSTRGKLINLCSFYS